MTMDTFPLTISVTARSTIRDTDGYPDHCIAIIEKTSHYTDKELRAAVAGRSNDTTTTWILWELERRKKTRKAIKVCKDHNKLQQSAHDLYESAVAVLSSGEPS